MYSVNEKSPEGDKGDMEQRAHMRREVTMPARMRVGPGQGKEQSCEVRDFCLGGVLLVLPEAVTPVSGAAPEAGMPITVLLSVAGVRGERTVELPGRVARREGDTLGVAFTGPDATDLLAVQNEVRRRLDGPGARAGQAGPRDSQRARQAARGVLRVFQHFCARALDAFFRTLETQEGDGAGREQLDAQRDALRREFLQRVSAPLESIAEGREPESLPAAGTGPDAAADSVAFQHWLALRVMASRTELRFNQELLTLQLRLDELFDISLNPRRNPLAPSVVCNAFGQAVDGLSLSEAVQRQQLLDTFENTVLARLGDFYRTINNALARSGVLADLDVSRYLNEHYVAPEG